MADSNSGYAAGITFVPIASGSANTITFAGDYDPGFTGQNLSLTPPPASDDFTISLYGGVPSPVSLLESSTLVGLVRSDLGSNFGSEIYEFSATLSTNLALTEGSSYFLGVTDLDTPDDSFFTYGSSSSTGNGYQSSDSGATFATDDIDTFNFSVSEKAVPEPSSWGMLLGSVALFAIWHRRRFGCR